MNIIWRILGFVVMVAQAWWNRFLVASGRGRLVWAAVPLIGFCMFCSLAQAALLGGRMTPTPTTVAEAIAPTKAPTEVPTEVPTVAPTVAPPVAPTNAPTIVPTEVPTAPPPTVESTASPVVASVGEDLRLGDFRWNVLYAEMRDSNPDEQEHAVAKVVVIRYELENLGTSTQDWSGFLEPVVIDRQGRTYELWRWQQIPGISQEDECPGPMNRQVEPKGVAVCSVLFGVQADAQDPVLRVGYRAGLVRKTTYEGVIRLD